MAREHDHPHVEDFSFSHLTEVKRGAPASCRPPRRLPAGSPQDAGGAAAWKAALLALLFLTCGREQRTDVFPRAPVILISVDTLRSDRLPAYGYGKVATPHIDALRRDGILYSHAYSHCPLTLPSHASMLTGLLPTEHGVRNNIGYRFDGEKFPTLARVLREGGYRTGAAVSSYVLRAETGIAHGFESYDDRVAVTAGGATSEYQRSGMDTLAPATQWIAQHANEPFFFFLHLYEPHAPYTPPEPFRSRYADAYDGEVAAADAVVGRLMETLKASGVYDRAIIVFASDHGEALWEHGEDQHGILLYREVLQVPLIVKLPGSAQGGSTMNEPFELRRVFDRILDLTGIEHARREAARGLYSETLYPRIHLGWSELRSLIDGRWHYIESSSPELYDLERDPGETRNLLSAERRVAASMRAALQSFPATNAPMERIDPEEAAKLAALGYLGTPRERTGPLPNPRQEIGTLQAIKSAFQLAAERRNDEAATALRALLEKNPRLTDASSRLGEVLMEAGRHDEAVEVYRNAIAQSERFSPDLALALAVAYLKAGKPREAAQHARLAERVNAREANEVLARAAMLEGRLGDAHAHIQRALGAGGQQPKTLLLAAELQRDAGSLEEALKTLAMADQRAAELKIDLMGADHLRGDVLARLDRPDEAVAAYHREIARFPQHLQSYANLAVVYAIQGRRADAERVLGEMVRANPHRGARSLAERTRAALRDS